MFSSVFPYLLQLRQRPKAASPSKKTDSSCCGVQELSVFVCMGAAQGYTSLSLIRGFHGLRPLNDGDLGSPRPQFCTLLRTYTYARHSEGAGLIICCHSEPAQQAKNPTNGSSMVTTTYAEILLSFSRSARESPGWLRNGSDVVLPCASSGDPRFARMTEEAATLPRPRLGVCP